jgi:hypothetical protein
LLNENARFPIKSITLILFVFAIVIAGAYLYRPFLLKRCVSRLHSEGPDVEKAIEYLAEKGGDAEDFLIESLKTNPGVFRWNAMRVLEKRDALYRVPEIVRLNYLLLRAIKEGAAGPWDSLTTALRKTLKESYFVAPALTAGLPAEVSADNLDHEWVLGVEGVVYRKVHGVKCIARWKDFTRLEDAEQRLREFIGSKSWPRLRDHFFVPFETDLLNVLVTPALFEDSSGQGLMGIAVSDGLGEHLLKTDDRVWASYSLPEIKRMPLLVVLSGYDFELKDNFIIIKMPGESLESDKLDFIYPGPK